RRLNASATSWLVISSKIIGYVLGGSPPPFPKLRVGIVMDGTARFFLAACPAILITFDAPIFRRRIRIIIVLRIVRTAQAHGVFPTGFAIVIAHRADVVHRA